jgi:hypothetical protein
MGETRTTDDRSLTSFEVELLLFHRSVKSSSLIRTTYTRSSTLAGIVPNRTNQYFVSMVKPKDWPRGPLVPRSSSSVGDMLGRDLERSLSQACFGNPINRMWTGPC